MTAPDYAEQIAKRVAQTYGLDQRDEKLMDALRTTAREGYTLGHSAGACR